MKVEVPIVVETHYEDRPIPSLFCELNDLRLKIEELERTLLSLSCGGISNVSYQDDELLPYGRMYVVFTRQMNELKKLYKRRWELEALAEHWNVDVVEHVVYMNNK